MMNIPHSYDYTEREKSMFGDAEGELICVRCNYEGEAASESEEANRQAIRGHALGWASIFGGFFGLAAGLVSIIAAVAFPWWTLALVLIGSVALIGATGWCGYKFGADSRRRNHTTLICPECQRDSLIPLNSRLGTQLHVRNQQPKPTAE